LGAAPAPPAEAPTGEVHRGIEYPAAAGFLTLGTMTVVYPAGPGEPVELNRRSAEARARFLAAVHKNKVTVAADDQLTEAQRKGNLLLLGWNNRVFGSAAPARPFTHGPQGTRFLAIVEPDPGVDLLVFHRNPLNWSSYVLFWTRIDPERDRFQVIPRVGSDWAMYRDYRVIRQGMFVPARVWPPARDTLAEADHTSDASTRAAGTASFDSEHYHVTFDRAAFKNEEVQLIAETRETAFLKAVAAVGPAPKGFRIRLFVYDNDDIKRQVTGVGDPSHEVPSARELHLTRRLARQTSPRDEIQLLAREVYGPCFLTSICEGLALSFETAIQGQDIEMQAASLRSSGKLPDLALLLDEERFRALVSQFGPAAAGVFMAWVRESYGAAGLKSMYGLAEGRPAALAAALGTNETALQASFASWADARVAARKNELAFLAAEDEAQERRLSSDWAGMVSALKRALAAKPGDPQTLFNLASAQMRADDLGGAETSLKAIITAKLAPADSRFRIFGHYQLGRVLDLAGRRAEALTEYDAVLALPDEHGAHALARDRKTKPATREQLE
jgi:tetratricopeptide (TPR) repeat protein